MEHGVGRTFYGFDGQRSGFNAGQIQQIIEQAMQMIAVAQHALQMSMLIGQQRSIAAEEQFCETENRADRSADFVAHMGEEIALRPAGTFCRVARCRQLSLHPAKMIRSLLQFSGSCFHDSGPIFDDSFQIRIQILQAAESLGVFQCRTCDRRQVPGDAQFIRPEQVPNFRVTNDQACGNPCPYHDRAGQQ